MEEGRLPPICSKRIRVLCQTVLIVASLIPLTGKDVFAEASARGGSGRHQILFAKNMQGNEMMENTKLYETIFKRKSIREYDLTPPENTLAKKLNSSGIKGPQAIRQPGVNM